MHVDVAAQLHRNEIRHEGDTESVEPVSTEEAQEEEDLRVVVDMSDDDKVEEGIPILEALAIAMNSYKPTLPENKAKNQVQAKPEEIASGSHREAT